MVNGRDTPAAQLRRRTRQTLAIQPKVQALLRGQQLEQQKRQQEALQKEFDLKQRTGTGKIKGRTFSNRAIAKAEENLLRKLQGKRISIQDPFEPGKILSEAQQDKARAATRLLFSIPQNRRDLARAAGRKFEKLRGEKAPTVKQLTEAQKEAADSGLPPAQQAALARKLIRDQGLQVRGTKAGDLDLSKLTDTKSVDVQKVLDRVAQRRGQGLPIGATDRKIIEGVVAPVTLGEKVSGVRKKFFERVGEISPETGGGLIEGLGLDRPFVKPPPSLKLETPTITTDITIPPGGGTLLTSQRQKTFFEEFGLDPNDPDAIKLQNDTKFIQNRLISGTLTESQASIEIDKNIDKFTEKQLLKGIPENAAVGAAVGIVGVVLPPVGIAATGFFLTDALIKRRQIANQFKKFPLAFSLSTGAFIAGGLTGAKIGAGVKGNAGNIKINPESFDSATFIRGAEKNKVKLAALEIFPELKQQVKQNKITDTIVYNLKMKDGRAFKIVEFSKLINEKISKDFIGFEVLAKGAKGRPEVFAGRGVGILKGKGLKAGELNFIRAIKFKHSNTPIGRFVQRRFGSGRIIDILEKATVKKQFVSKTTGKPGDFSVTKLEVESRLLGSKKAGADAIKDIVDLIENIKNGKKISLFKVRKVLNIERKLNGEKPFTDAQFRSANVGTLSDVILLKVLGRVKGTVEVVIKKNVRAAAITARRRGGIIGGAKTRGKIFPEDKPKTLATVTELGLQVTEKTKGGKKTPLSDTFRKPSLILESIKKAKKTLGEKYREAQSSLKRRGEVPQLVTLKAKPKAEPRGAVVSEPLLGALSPGTAAIIVNVPLATRTSLTSIPTFSALGFSLTPKGVQFTGIQNPQNIRSQVDLIDNRINTFDRNIIQLKNLSVLNSFQKNRLDLLNNQKAALKNLQNTLIKVNAQIKIRTQIKVKQELRVQQKVKQRTKIRQRNRTIQRSNIKSATKTPKPPPPFGGDPSSISKKRGVGGITKRNKGFDTLVKSRGKFKKQNLVPLSKRKADDLGAFLVDKSTARSWVTPPAKKTAQKPKLKVPQNYFSNTVRKYRGKKTKGIEAPLTSRGNKIERSKFAIDSLGEKRQLSVARQKAKLLKAFKSRQKNKAPKIKSTRLI